MSSCTVGRHDEVTPLTNIVDIHNHHVFPHDVYGKVLALCQICKPRRAALQRCFGEFPRLGDRHLHLPNACPVMRLHKIRTATPHCPFSGLGSWTTYQRRYHRITFSPEFVGDYRDQGLHAQSGKRALFWCCGTLRGTHWSGRGRACRPRWLA